MNLPLPIKSLFEAYRDAFNALDGAAVAELYAQPSGIDQEGVYTHWAERTAVRANMDALCALYRTRGFVRSDYRVRHAQALGDHAFFADLEWSIDWAGGEPACRFGTAYHLIRSSSGWQVLLCTAYAEAALLRA